ncbi:hypothetical protein THER5_0293 [Bifidobacterium thermacidophilum subsp. thermacidophilum]|uniref:Uncharacterized protein n=1 Tax=Bifidobacterium thermacidophilum subsp. thermacidophilum TaxID=79262 RepID=A0A087E2W8_9BIFI|nr:hypothetical protein THER5_0293 [Bifidobacterium thermacidophilum subsp. thermacidophilum]
MPVQRNNLSWLYTTVGFCSLKFSLYLLLCPDSRRPQLDIVVCGGIVHLFAQVFDGTSRRGNLADSCAHRTGSHVRLCAHRKTRRSHRSGSPSPNQPFPHKSVPEHTFHHAIDVLGTQRQQRGAGRHALPTAELSVTRFLADRSGISAISRMRRHTSCTETKRTDAQTHRNLQVMHAMTFADRQI